MFRSNSLVAIAAACLYLLIGDCAYAQVQTVNINKASLQWTWIRGQPPDDGMPDKFVVKCGQASKNYVKLTDYIFAPSTSNTFSLPIRQVIGGNGQWYCTVDARNKYGASADANELPFDAGAPPSMPNGVILTVQ